MLGSFVTEIREVMSAPRTRTGCQSIQRLARATGDADIRFHDEQRLS
jgi:hypothetical protein